MKVAVIGRREVTDAEAQDLKYLGKIMARRGIELITNGIDGTADMVRTGYESLNLPGASSSVMRAEIFDHADRVVVYTDSTLDSLLETRGVIGHPKIVRIDGHKQLKEFIDAAVLVTRAT